MSDFGKFISGFFIGGMVGGLLGVLLAPQSGTETRQRISDSTHETYKKAEAIDDLQKSGQDVLKKVSDALAKKDDEIATEAEENPAEG